MNQQSAPYRPSRREREQGSVTAFVVVLAATFIVLGGLIYDGGRAEAAKTAAIDVAQQAARTAAHALNPADLRNNLLATTPGQAIADAEAYIAANGDTGTVTITGQTISVTVVHHQPTAFLGLVGIGEITVTGAATTQVEQGLDTPVGQGR